MQIGLALPQYDYSVAGERPLRFETIVEHARLAERGGADSVWLSDHLFLDLAKYGGSAGSEGCFDPIVTLAALARAVPRVRLGTLVLLEALRPAAVLAKALATVDRVSGGRLDVGLGAGWYEPEYAALGMAMPRAGERLDRLVDALEVVKGLLGGGPFTYEGVYHRARGNEPTACRAAPPAAVFVGGKGDRLLRLAAAHADGWNTCWVWTPDAYRERLRVLDDACARVGRDPATMWRTLGLYALCGEDERDLERRFDRLREQSPTGVLDGIDLATFRVGRLVGTVDEVRRSCTSGRRWVSTRSCSASARCRSRCRLATTSSSCSRRARFGECRRPSSRQLGGDGTSSRRRRRMRRRSRSDAPPHTPCSMRLSSTYSRHSVRTGQPSQMCWADSTPSPSDGKNSVGLAPRQRACSIQAYSSGVSSTITSPSMEPYGSPPCLVRRGPTVSSVASPHVLVLSPSDQLPRSNERQTLRRWEARVGFTFRVGIS